MVKIFFGNLPDGGNIGNDDIRPLFEEFGVVTECEVIGVSKNYGFCHMDSEAAAAKAIETLNGRDMKGRPMRVERSESRGPARTATEKLFVGNIADGTTDLELRTLFEKYGKVVEADVMTGKNFGFVHMDSALGRAKVNDIVRELNGADLKGNAIRVQFSANYEKGDRGGRGRGPPMRDGGYGGGGYGGYDRGGRGGGYGDRRGGGYGDRRGGGGRGGYGRDDGGYGGGGYGGGRDGYGGGRDGYGGGRDDYGGGRDGYRGGRDGYGGGRGGGGGYRGGRDAPYPPPRHYRDFAEDSYGRTDGGGPMRGRDRYGGGYGRDPYDDMYSRRSPPRGGRGGYGGGYGGGYSGDY